MDRNTFPLIEPQAGVNYRRLYIDNPGAGFNGNGGQFETGNTTGGGGADFGRIELANASNLVQDPMDDPIGNEFDETQRALRARRVQNELAIRKIEANDPDYQFFYQLAGALNMANVNQVINPIYFATDTLSDPNFPTKKETEVAQPADPNVPNSKPTPKKLSYAVDPAKLTGSYKLNPRVKQLYEQAVNAIKEVAPKLFTNIPIFARELWPTDREATEAALRSSVEVRADFCALIACKGGVMNVTQPKNYMPQQVLPANLAMETGLLEKFRSRVRWAQTMSEKTQRGALIMEPEHPAFSGLPAVWNGATARYVPYAPNLVLTGWR